MDVNTRGGTFGPGGYGGGIFDGSQMGFGGLGQFEQAAAGIMGLGAGEAPFVWCSRTSPCAKSDPRVVALQTTLNTYLKKYGLKTLTVDGKFGPATCGAIVWSGKYASEVYADPKIMAYSQALDASGNPVCKSYTMPTPVGSTKPLDINTEYNIQLPPTGAQWQQPNPDLPGLQRGINHDLDEHGYEPIGITGMLDGPTCGAMQFAKDQWGMSDYMQRYGGNCQAFTPPRKAVALAPPPGPAPGPEPEEETHAAIGARKSGVSTAWVIGGLAVAAGLAGLYSVSKKR